MIDFKCNKGHISKAVFAGSPDDIVAELAMAISLLYGSLKREDEEEAEKFKRGFAMTIFHDAMIRDADEAVIFNEKLVTNIAGDDDYACTIKSVRADDKKSKKLNKTLEFLEMLEDALGSSDDD